MKRPTFLVQRDALDRIRLRLKEASDPIPTLEELCACHRINALSAIFHAGRGWLGASLSCAEVLTVIYHAIARLDEDPLRRDAVVLGKGHAAAMQYACLAGVGLLPVEELLKYKRPDGPQAHTDRSTPGIDANTGSLGQALSKCCGLAMANRSRRVFAILGDGELQEGQCFEAFATMHGKDLRNLTAIIDRNGIQTDSSVADIKPIADLEGVLRGFGLRVIAIDGNDPSAVLECLGDPGLTERPTVVIADTVKGAGVSFMAARSCQRRGYQWHGGAPDRAAYLRALTELSRSIRDARLSEALSDFIARHQRGQDQVSKPAQQRPSTGEAFASALFELAERRDDVMVLDADLEHACRLTDIARAFPDRFVEMGISEADMVSCAGGLALRGKLPVVNTYAAFFRRAFEQIYVNASEETRIIYAGHYAGLCYATDGKTHQCTGDVAMMRSIPGMAVLYPAFAEELAQMLEWVAAGEPAGPVYIRLHRTPATSEVTSDEPLRFVSGRGLTIRDRGASAAMVTSGPHLVSTCAGIAEDLSVDLIALSTLRGLSPEYAAELSERYQELLVVEELVDASGLLDELSRAMASLEGAKRPMIRHKAVDGWTCSTLEPDGLYRRFGLDEVALRGWVSSVL